MADFREFPCHFFSQSQFHLVDSIAKKLKVVEGVAGEIGLKNITTQHIRAEEIKNRKFDFAVSRAVAPLKELWKWSKTLAQKITQISHSIQDIPNFISRPHLSEGR